MAMYSSPRACAAWDACDYEKAQQLFVLACLERFPHFLRKSCAFIMSFTGMPSVMHTINSIPASAASMIASAANGGGTKIIEQVAAEVAKHPAAYPQMIATSARTGAGIPELRAAVAALVPNAIVP